MPDLSFPVVFLGGVLAILSPCSALLPAFFAVAFASRVQLLRAAVLFYLGLATIFVPLGLGVSFLASLLFDQRPLVILVAGALLLDRRRSPADLRRQRPRGPSHPRPPLAI